MKKLTGMKRSRYTLLLEWQMTECMPMHLRASSAGIWEALPPPFSLPPSKRVIISNDFLYMSMGSVLHKRPDEKWAVKVAR
jgi:hypothetical protein